VLVLVLVIGRHSTFLSITSTSTVSLSTSTKLSDPETSHTTH
jgi:hypothetical protein